MVGLCNITSSEKLLAASLVYVILCGKFLAANLCFVCKNLLLNFGFDCRSSVMSVLCIIGSVFFRLFLCIIGSIFWFG